MTRPAESTAPMLSRRPLARFRPGRFTLLLAGIAVLGAALVLAREVTYGVALSWDSVEYIGVAGSLLAGDGFTRFFGGVYKAFPPLYPVLLAAGSLFLFDPRDVAGPLNAVIFGLIIFVAGRYLRLRLQSRFLVGWACLVIALAIPLTEIASHAMSETTFILLAILALIQTDAFLIDGKRSALLWAAAFTALACLTRFMGVTVLAAIVLLLLCQRGIALPDKAKRIAVYALIAATPVGLWILRTFLLTGTPTGTRGRTFYSLPEILDGMLDVVVKQGSLDLQLGDAAFIPVVGLAGLSLLALAAAVCYTFVRALPPGDTWTNRRPFYIFGGFGLVYLILLTVAMLLGNTWDGVQPRFLTPVYIPLLFAALFVIDQSWSYVRERRQSATDGRLSATERMHERGQQWPSLLAASIVIPLSLILVHQSVLQAGAITEANEGANLGYDGKRWTDSETLQYVRESALTGMIFSNDAAATYIHTDLPAKHRYWSCTNGKLQSQLPAEGVEDGIAVHGVWFYNRCGESDSLTPADLRTTPGLEPVAKLSDGAIFKVNRNYDPASALRAEYAAIASGEPLIRSDFVVYLNGRTMHYIRDTCREQDTTAMFFLHVTPSDANDLPAHRKQYGFDHHDFSFNQYGLMFDGKCWAERILPQYDIAAIRTGQYVLEAGDFNNLWEAEFPFMPGQEGTPQ